MKAARKALKYSQSELACALDTPKRTIQDWEGGKCRLPGVLGVAMGLLREKDEAVMTWIAEKIKRDLARDYPQGIPSVMSDEEHGEELDDAA